MGNHNVSFRKNFPLPRVYMSQAVINTIILMASRIIYCVCLIGVYMTVVRFWWLNLVMIRFLIYVQLLH